MAKYLLGIDNGSTLVKAAVFTTDGREVSVASHKVDLLAPCPGYSEVDMHALWQLTAASIRDALAQAEVQPADILGVACTGHGNGLYLVDAQGQPVRPGIRGADTRARE